MYRHRFFTLTPKEYLQSEGSWLSAIEKLETGLSLPFGAYSEQVQLDLIYAYYKNDDLALGLATISRVLRLAYSWKTELGL